MEKASRYVSLVKVMGTVGSDAVRSMIPAIVGCRSGVFVC